MDAPSQRNSLSGLLYLLVLNGTSNAVLGLHQLANTSNKTYHLLNK